MMFENHRQHRAADKASEEHHDGDGSDSGHTPDEILNADLYFIDKIGLKEHLSPTRSNGLLSMVKQMRMYALAFKAKGI